MTDIKRGQIIDINLEPTKGSETGKVRPCIVVTNDIYNEKLTVIQVVPITEWSEKKSKIKTNIEIHPTSENGLVKLSIADCLQTRPVDYKYRLVGLRGDLNNDIMAKIDQALKIVFGLS
jgi:mRNA interferase MazF